jgi:hypothetical protein
VTFVHLDTHTVEPVERRLEVWFDTRKHGLAASVGGCIRLVGASSRTGCVGSIRSGAPDAFIGAIDHYRAALASGSVKKTANATVRGRRAWWLRVTGSGLPHSPGYSLFVAVDQKTGNPLRLETRKGASVVDGEDIDLIAHAGKLPRDVLAATPTPANSTPAHGERHIRSGAIVSLAEAARLVPGALWPGPTAAGLRFHRARVLTLDDGSKQLELLYGAACPDHCVLIKQSAEAGWAPADHTYTKLPDRTIVLTGGRHADGRAGPLKIRLEGKNSTAILTTTRHLRPL